MSTNNRIIVVIGLAVMGLLEWAVARDMAYADEPGAPNSSATITPQVQDERYLLLTNGQLVHGVVTENESEFLVVQRVGLMRFAKKRVEGAFGSIREAYVYRLQQLPNGDFDEGMKLALWCLNLKLTSEAKEILTEIIKHNPNNNKAKAMLVSIDQAAARASVRLRDPDVRQARVDEMREDRAAAVDDRRRPGIAEQPAVLDGALLRQARQRLGIADLPVIFDLPAPLAIKRSGEFFLYVHPLLQKHCAKCHDGQYDGSFQLVPITKRADRTPDALRANLDATLRLVDSKAPSHSELLSSTLRPHGRGPRPRPIFTGSNDPTYRILASWVNSLSSPRAGNDVARADQTPARVNQAESFAADRNRANSDPLNFITEALSNNGGRSPFSAGVPVESKTRPPSRVERNRGSIVEGQNPGDPQEFPLPFVITGAKPNIATPGALSKAPAKPSPKASAGDAAPNSAGSATERAGNSVMPGSPAAPTVSPHKANEKSEPGTVKKTNKPIKLDPAALERALQIRNANRQSPPAE